MIKQYRKKPVIIEAVEYNGTPESQSEIVNWTEGYAIGMFDGEYHLVIKTLEGEMRVSQGDFVIRGVQGEFYPCKPDIFWQTYEEVEPELQNVPVTDVKYYENVTERVLGQDG